MDLLKLMSLFADNRGFMTANGQPDQSRSARYVLKDYVNGKLLYCVAPSEHEQLEFHKFPARVRPAVDEAKLPARQQRAMRVSFNFLLNSFFIFVLTFSFQCLLQINHTKTSSDIDKVFFDETQHTAYIKGKTNLSHIRGLTKEGSTSTSTLNGSGTASVAGSVQSLNGVHLLEKPWRHQKKERREKLRKRFSHLDEH